MKTLKFKTNIKCTGCLSKVTPVLNEEKAIKNWNVDLESNERVLSVKTENMDVEKVIKLIEKTGYSAQEIK